MPDRHPRLCPPVLSMGMLENHIPTGPGGCLHTAGLGSIPGVVPRVGWVERKAEEDVNLGKRSGML